MRQIPKPYEKYRHFKGGIYQVLCVAQHTESGEYMVVYQALYGSFGMFVRPLDMFMEPVDRKKYPGVIQEFRFELLQEEQRQVQRQMEPLAQESRPAETSVPAAVHREKGSQTIEDESADDTGYRQMFAAGESDSIEYPQSFAGEKSGTDNAEGRQIFAVGKIGSIDCRQTFVEEKADSAEGYSLNQPEAVPEEEGPGLDPLLLEFLDADSYGQRLNILSALHHRITDDMINVMAMATDLEVPEGDVEERWMQLRGCLQKLARFECSR